MKTTIAWSVVVLLSVGTACAAPTPTNPATTDDEAAAERGDVGKADYSEEIVFASYSNEHVLEVGEFTRLELTPAAEDELPAAHYEGRYSLTETTADGTRDSSGFFNVYRYRGDLWIRFLDEETGGYETKFEKYAWIYWNDTLVLRGHMADWEFFMRLPFYGSEVGCVVTELLDDNVFEEGLSIEEYPDVDIERNAVSGRLQVGIGASSFDTDDGDDIQVTVTDTQVLATIDWGDETIQVVGPADGTGPGHVMRSARGTHDLVATLRCTGETTPLPSRTASCTMTRLDTTPQGPGVATASLALDSEEDFADPDRSLDAFDGNYSFTIITYDGGVSVVVFENIHAQDEVGSFNCDPADTDESGAFCQESIIVDSALGTDGDSAPVHAFDFSCRFGV